MKNSLLELIISDLSRIIEPTLFNFIKTYLFPKGYVYRYVFWLRIMQWIKSQKLSFLFLGWLVYPIFRHYEFKYGIHVNSNIHIGKGLFIVHGDGVYLNCKSIGDNFTCYQGVTIGTNSYGGLKPTIGNNVVAYTNSVIVGNIICENNSEIAANSFVNKNVKCNTIVAGSPARIIKYKESIKNSLIVN